jgi:heterodisulfide reductase subunit C2
MVKVSKITNTTSASTPEADILLVQIETLAHTKTANCYQCGKCTAGCPVSEHMELMPNQIVRLLQLGRADKALRSSSIWKCVSCLTCSTRCPQEVDPAGLMDALRQLSLEQGIASLEAQPVVAFQKAFLENIRRNGRLHELELIALFKGAVVFGSRQLSFLFQDAMLAPQLMKRKKLHLAQERSEDREVVARIYARCIETGEK